MNVEMLVRDEQEDDIACFRRAGRLGQSFVKRDESVWSMLAAVGAQYPVEDIDAVCNCASGTMSCGRRANGRARLSQPDRGIAEF